jgi:hypothetical protein
LKLDAQAKELVELNKQAAELARLQSGLRNSQRGQVASSLIADNDVLDGSPSRKGRERERERVMGTRISARLRGSARHSDDGEWQAVPQEWLTSEEGVRMINGEGKKEEADEDEDWLRDAAVKTGLEREGSEISDLTELSENNGSATGSDDEDGEEEEEEEITQEVKQEEVQSRKRVDDRGIEDPPALPEGFIEWETVRFPRLNKTISHLHGLCRYV